MSDKEKTMNHKDKKEADASQRGIMIRELIARFTSDHLIGKKIKNGELRKKLVEPAWNGWSRSRAILI